MTLSSAIFEYADIIVGSCFELAILYFAIRRKLYRHLLFFFLYIAFLVPKDFLWLYFANSSSFDAYFKAYYYWSTDFICSFLRLATICEIYWRIFCGYSTIWSIAKWVLGSVLGISLLWTSLTVWRHLHDFRDYVTLGLQSMELSQSALILIILAIGVYYGLRIPPFYRWVLTGIFIYSAVQIVNYELGTIRNGTAGIVFSYVHRIAFIAPQVIWTWALWRLTPAQVRLPDRIPQEMYDEISPRVHDRLRELNDQLAAVLWRKHGK